MTPSARLGLAEDADEREVKRAYARELKRVRPDEDPAGFQALHEAYVHCLALARGQTPPPVAATSPQPPPGADAADTAPAASATAAAANDEPSPWSRAWTGPQPQHPPQWHGGAQPGTDDPAPLDAADWDGRHAPERSAPESWPSLDLAAVRDGRHGSAAEAEFDPHAFLQRLTEIACTQPADQLGHWLQAHPALYSVEFKRRLVPMLIDHLFDEPPLQPDALETVLAFFDMDSVHPLLPELEEDVAALRADSLQLTLEFDGAGFASSPASRQGEAAAGSGPPWSLFVWVLGIALMLGAILRALSNS